MKTTKRELGRALSLAGKYISDTACKYNNRNEICHGFYCPMGCNCESPECIETIKAHFLKLAKEKI